MTDMENTYPNFGQPHIPLFAAQQGYDSAAVYSIPPISQPPPPPKWPNHKALQGKRGGYNNKHNFRIPSTKVNIKKLRKQNAQGARRHFAKGKHINAAFYAPVNDMLTDCVCLAGRGEPPKSVPPAPYNSNAYLSSQSGKFLSLRVAFHAYVCGLRAVARHRSPRWLSPGSPRPRRTQDGQRSKHTCHS